MSNEVGFDETNDETQSVTRSIIAFCAALPRFCGFVLGIGMSGQMKFSPPCDTNPSAEVAMRELWENTAQVYDPQDYDSVVKEYIATKQVIDAIQSQLAVLSNDKTSGTSLYVVSIPVKVDYQDGNFETTFVGPMSIRPDA